jgi:hypothetical protein
VLIHGHSSLPKPSRLPPRDTPLEALELRDIYKSHRPILVARIELVSSQYTHFLINAVDNTVLAIPMEDMLAHFTVGGLARPEEAYQIHPYRSPTVLPLGPRL